MLLLLAVATAAARGSPRLQRWVLLVPADRGRWRWWFQTGRGGGHRRPVVGAEGGGRLVIPHDSVVLQENDE